MVRSHFYRRSEKLPFNFSVPSCTPLEWNTPPPSAYHIAFEFIASLAAFPDGSSCFTLVMRASRHVFMSFEDFFGDQDTFVSDQTSEKRPPSVQTREKHATWNFFLPQLRFKQRFNRFVEKITPCRETSLVPTKEESSYEDVHPAVDSSLSPVYRVRLFPCTVKEIAARDLWIW